MKTQTFTSIALAGLLLAGCEQKTPPGAETTPFPTPAPSPSLSPTATPEATPSSPSPSPLKSPEEPTAAVTPSPTASSTATPESTPSLTPSPSVPTSDARPTFSSQSANEYVQSYDAYINDFKLAYQAMKRGDMTKYQTVIQRAHELESKGEKLGGELSPEEEARFADYLSKKADELAQFATQNH
jgi:hypothetical protein